MSDDLKSAKTETLKLLLTPDKADEGWVNEGPFVVKHNGSYYLTYSTNFYFQSNYSVCYATSSSPLRIYTRYENNPILKGNAFVSGTRHHCFITDADTNEMYIVYHCHNSVNEVHNRKICIDRAEFVAIKDGQLDELILNGPTVSKQFIK